MVEKTVEWNGAFPVDCGQVICVSRGDSWKDEIS